MADICLWHIDTMHVHLLVQIIIIVYQDTIIRSVDDVKLQVLLFQCQYNSRSTSCMCISRYLFRNSALMKVP